MIKPLPLKKYVFDYTSLILLLPFLLVLGGSLINTDFFYYRTSSAYYLFVFFTAAAALTAGALLLRHKILQTGFSIPFMAVALWCFYIILHGFVKGTSAQVQGYYFAAFILLCSAVCIFSHVRFSFLLLFWLIFTLSLAEALLCIAQYAGLLSSKSSYFAVTGSYTNPNVTAMFMAMSLPIIPVLFISRRKHTKRILFLSSGIIVLALFLLKCRSAIIGGALGLAVFFALKYRLLTWVKDHKNRQALFIMIFIGMGLMLLLAKITYGSKKASADGRLLVWKVTSGMIAEKPLSGSGYGFFERDYNLAQARYIANGQASPKELKNAGHVNMAYNEFLQNAAEGGLPGLLLFSGMLFSIILISLSTISKSFSTTENNKDKDPAAEINPDYLIAACSGIVAFCSMSVVNFTIQAVPVVAVFILYVAVINKYLPQKKYTSASKPQLFTGIMLLLAGAGIIFMKYPEAAAYRQNKIASEFLKTNQPENAISVLSGLTPQLPLSESYWKNYAQALFMAKHPKNALLKIETAKQLSSTPELYHLSGACYTQLGLYTLAMAEYQQAAWLEPSRFKPRYQLMVNALRAGKIQHAITAAQEIISLEPKIPSKKVVFYKNAAKKMLKKHHISIVSPTKSLYAY